jgi:hypothetical protein
VADNRPPDADAPALRLLPGATQLCSLSSANSGHYSVSANRGPGRDKLIELHQRQLTGRPYGELNPVVEREVNREVAARGVADVLFLDSRNDLYVQLLNTVEPHLL